MYKIYLFILFVVLVNCETPGWSNSQVTVEKYKTGRIVTTMWQTTGTMTNSKEQIFAGDIDIPIPSEVQSIPIRVILDNCAKLVMLSISPGPNGTHYQISLFDSSMGYNAKFPKNTKLLIPGGTVITYLAAF